MTINAYGRALSNMCITNKLCFLNGRTRGDRLGNFTCLTYNGASVVDYAIVGHDVLENIIYFTVHPDRFIQPLLYFICSENYYFYD